MLLVQEGRSRAFTLYVSPPRQVLQDSAVLQDQGMVPAAVVYLAWDEVRQSRWGLGVGGYG